MNVTSRELRIVQIRWDSEDICWKCTINWSFLQTFKKQLEEKWKHINLFWCLSLSQPLQQKSEDFFPLKKVFETIISFHYNFVFLFCRLYNWRAELSTDSLVSSTIFLMRATVIWKPGMAFSSPAVYHIFKYVQIFVHTVLFCKSI